MNLTLGKLLAVFFGLVAIAFVGATLIMMWTRTERPAVTEEQVAQQAAAQRALLAPRALPEFTLTDQTGAPFSKQDLAGKVWLANFIFTDCPGQCIILTNQFKDFQEKIADLEDVRLVSTSVNPETDTPEKLTAYARQYEAGDQWTFLTGEHDDVYALMEKGFLLSAAPNPDPETAALGETIIHSLKVVLVDADGNVRRYYEGLPEDSQEQVLADIRALLPRAAP
ncbi:MAG: SCO family protein [Verrucomicrobiota bacterium]